jgi:hypothetical protein
MVWDIISYQVPIQHRVSKTGKDDHNNDNNDNNSKQSLNHNFSTQNVRSLENKNIPPSTDTQILCSICERNDNYIFGILPDLRNTTGHPSSKFS